MPRRDSPLRTAVPALLRTTGALSPALGGRLALRVFFRTSPRMAVRASEAATHESARQERLRVNGKPVVAYRWGAEQAPTVLLLHGWGGRAAQFSPLVRELVAEGLAVVAFDAPAHGASGWRRTDIRDWLEAIRRLEPRRGFVAVIGHSFGGLAALTAVRAGLRTGAVAVVASAASPATFRRVFADGVGLDAATRKRFDARFRARLGVDAEAETRRYDAVADPLPESVRLLVVHDGRDRTMPDADALRLHAAHGDRSTLLRTEGLGHARILGDDRVLDALVALATGAAAREDPGNVVTVREEAAEKEAEHPARLGR